MATSSDALQAYMAAISNPSEETAAALAPFLTAGVTVVGLIGPGAGKDAVLASLSAPAAPKFLAGATWSEPQTADDTTVVEATLPTGSPLGGLSVEVTCDAEGKITHAGQSIVGVAASAATPIAISDDLKATIDGALANGTPFVLGYVDAGGVPHLSLRGTVQVFDAQTLATWARDPGAGLPRAIAANPHVTLLYRDPKTRSSYTFSGRAAITTDAAARETVFANSPEVERNIDGRKRGVAILIELDSVEGGGPGGRVNMRRA